MFAKPLFLLIAGIALATGLSAAHLDTSDDKPGLELSILLRDEGHKMPDYTLIVYCDDGSAPDTIRVEMNKSVYVKLSYHHNYTIRHIKEGYRERVLLVNTHVDEKTAKRWLVFDYEIELVREDEPANTLADLPIAVVHYHKNLKNFEYDRNYHQQVRQSAAASTITKR